MTTIDAVRDKVRSKLLVEQCRVIEVRPHSARLIEIQVESVDGQILRAVPGSHVAVALDGPTRSPLGAWRRYTVMTTGQAPNGGNSMSWLAFVDGDRPGTRFHRALRIGEPVSIRIGRSEPAIDALVQRCVTGRSALTCVGDETAIGLFTSLHSRRIDKRAWLVVGDEQDAVIPELAADRVRSFGSRPELIAALHTDAAHHSAMSFLVVGEKSLVSSVRSMVRKAGISSDRIAARVYWAPGKVGPE
jgi:hypothetical protein